jgi:hypothetical protein
MITFSSVTGRDIVVITIIILVILHKIGDSIVKRGLESLSYTERIEESF